jgi:hypothetical protein
LHTYASHDLSRGVLGLARKFLQRKN